MSLHDKSAALMIELLSLEHKQDGYQIEVGLTHSGGFVKKVLLIDEYTYLQMNSLGPFEGQRVRLSLYPKWDPFRRTYFSTLIKMNRTFSETLYFVCSEDYVSQLAQMKQQDLAPPEQEQEVQAALPSFDFQPVKRRNTVRFARPIVLRCILFSFLFVLFLLRMDGKLFSSAEAHEDLVQAGAAVDSSDSDSSLPYVPVIRMASFQSGQAEAAPAPTEAPKKPDLLYEEIELGEDSYEYGLPKGYVALSFDDGPSQYTRQIVDILQEQGVAANFLFVGKNAQRHPEEVSYAYEHGMPVGNHSWDHSDMTENSSAENRTNLARASQELEQNIHSPVTIFRPPYGAVNDELAGEARKQHLKVLLWNRDPEDWKADTTTQILHYFHTTEPSGGIYLLHEKAITVEALPQIIEYLKGKQLKFAIFK